MSWGNPGGQAEAIRALFADGTLVRRMKKILTEAVAVGNATARAIVFRSRQKDAYFYPDSAWCTPFIGGSYQFLSQPGVHNLDARTFFFYYATA
jgi:hypothetical protein